MKKISLIIVATAWLVSFSMTAQVFETKNWCLSRCDLAGDELHNSELIRLQLKNDSIQKHIANRGKVKVPLRLAIIQTDTFEVDLQELAVRKAIDNLNKSFEQTNLLFYLKKTDVILSHLKLEDLSQDLYQPYNEFSKEYDLRDMISIYVFDYKNEFCTRTQTTLSCGRTGGFSFIISDNSLKIVMSRFDLSDIKILAHEMGHLGGLYHTFEEVQFGKDDFYKEKCKEIGDMICDTPPDPGGLYEVYVNYSDCELLNYKNAEGHSYKPLIQNFMSYYKPCYLKEYSFTSGQVDVINAAATLPIRTKYLEID